MVVWLKGEDGRTHRLVDHWSPSIFIAADEISELATPLRVARSDFVLTREARRFERITDTAMSTVIEAKLRDAKRATQVAARIEAMGPFGAFRLYNVDVPTNQSYLYEHEIFPLAHCEVTQGDDGLQWGLSDDVAAYEYQLPHMSSLKVDVEVDKRGRIPQATDSIGRIIIKHDDEEIVIAEGDESDKLLGLVREVRRIDPDFVLTKDGDTFLLPYLIRRAEAHGISDQFRLDRDESVLRLPAKDGTSYFSYGKILYKPSSIKLYGRVHIDVNSSFAYGEAGFEGLFELSRLCRMPMHTSSRASIGKALSSLQFYHASKRGLLVPWKPTLSEVIKDRNELLAADRGGLVFEPIMGVHEGVGELDFSSLYPNIMLRKNISAETVKCGCCPSSSNRVPELGWNVCERQTGLVPSAIEIIVNKRLKYKELKLSAKGTSNYKKYNERQAVLKWLGVTTFGYLGFNNAKFGRIDAHIAVCAWDRKILLDTMRIAEAHGFRLIHCIVDSLWLKKEDGKLTEPGEYLKLRSEIEERTGFPLSFEGEYKWIVFLPSRENPATPVLNRYFGVDWSGELKVRGVEARRHDTPLSFKKWQMEIIRLLAEADSRDEARSRVSDCIGVFLRCAESLERHEVPAAELAFTTNLSKDPSEYHVNTVQSAAVHALESEGVRLHAGEGIHYVITDYKGRGSKRATPLDAWNASSSYDARRYIELLARTCAAVLEPFNPKCSASHLLSMHMSRKIVPLS